MYIEIKETFNVSVLVYAWESAHYTPQITKYVQNNDIFTKLYLNVA